MAAYHQYQTNFNRQEMAEICPDYTISPQHTESCQRWLINKIMEDRGIKSHRFVGSNLYVTFLLPFTNVYVAHAAKPLLILELVDIRPLLTPIHSFFLLPSTQRDRELTKVLEKETMGGNYNLPVPSTPLIHFSNNIMKSGQLRVDNISRFKNIKLYYDKIHRSVTTVF